MTSATCVLDDSSALLAPHGLLTPPGSLSSSSSQRSVADAMRDFLEAFRLPGESQQIARIAETFAAIYFAVNPGAF